ncbi:MAG: flagellar motor switch protein FliM [Acidimicrobiaceae bacterium]|nr:flagellar motor switch protein FliM [Acidimicrobiaceae bacterium]
MTGGVRSHDFRRSEGIDRSFVRALHAVFDTFARHATVDLSTQLRTQCQCQFGGVDEMLWREAAERLGDPPYLVTFTLPPFIGTAVFAVRLGTAMRMLEFRLGGGSSPQFADHGEPTETDFGILAPLFTSLLDELARALARVRETTAVLVGQESNLQFVQLTTPNEMCLLANFELTLADDEPSEAVLCLPFALIRQIIEAMRATQARATNLDALTDGHEQVLQVPMRLHLEIPPIELLGPELAALRPGDVLRLYHPVERPLDLRAEGVLVARARQGRSGARMACSVVEEVHE